MLYRAWLRQLTLTDYSAAAQHLSLLEEPNNKLGMYDAPEEAEIDVVSDDLPNEPKFSAYMKSEAEPSAALDEASNEEKPKKTKKKGKKAKNGSLDDEEVSVPYDWVCYWVARKVLRLQTLATLSSRAL